MSDKEMRARTVGTTKANKLKAVLLQEMESGCYKEAEKLPTEEELVLQWGVSRPVVRDALSDLEAEGFLFRARGVGTVINRRILTAGARMDLEIEFMPLVSAAGYTPGLDHSKTYEIKADAVAAERLEIPLGEPLMVCERRILADGKPVAFAVDYFAKNMLELPKFSKIDWTWPIFEILEWYCGYQVVTDCTQLHAMVADAHLAEMLEIENGAPLLHLDEIGFGIEVGSKNMLHSRPVLWSKEYYVQGVLNLILLRKRINH